MKSTAGGLGAVSAWQWPRRGSTAACPDVDCPAQALGFTRVNLNMPKQCIPHCGSSFIHCRPLLSAQPCLIPVLGSKPRQCTPAGCRGRWELGWGGEDDKER